MGNLVISNEGTPFGGIRVSRVIKVVGVIRGVGVIGII